MHNITISRYNYIIERPTHLQQHTFFSAIISTILKAIKPTPYELDWRLLKRHRALYRTTDPFGPEPLKPRDSHPMGSSWRDPELLSRRKRGVVRSHRPADWFPSSWWPFDVAPRSASTTACYPPCPSSISIGASGLWVLSCAHCGFSRIYFRLNLFL